MAIRIQFFGQVQGVFFRKTTESFAQSLDVQGYVKNLPDGSVELVATGSEIESLLSKLKQHFGEKIERMQWSEAPGESFETFEIRY